MNKLLYLLTNCHSVTNNGYLVSSCNTDALGGWSTASGGPGGSGWGTGAAPASAPASASPCSATTLG